MQRGVSRRDLLRLGALTVGALLTGRAAAVWLPGRKGRVTFAAFSDTHVGLRARIAENLGMLREIESSVQPAFAVNVGDITDYGWDGEYANYRRLKEALSFPILDVPGNHDVRWSPLGMQVFRRHLGEPHRARREPGLLVVALDSTVPLSHWGHFEKAQIDWLRGLLEEAGKETPVVLATHHWVGWGTKMVDNEDELLEAIRPFNVRLILTGHGHKDLLWRWDGIPCTMGSGLYQGSYQSVTVDFDSGELAVSRRTAQQPHLREFLRTPLGPERKPRPRWSVAAEALSGRAVLREGQGATEARWNAEPFRPVSDALSDTSGRPHGSHSITLRAGEEGPWQTFPVTILREEAKLLQLWEAELPGGVMSHVRVRGDRVYLSCMDGSVVALDRRTGRRDWTAQTEGYCHSTPLIEGGRLWVGSADGRVHCLDAANGQRLWRKATGGPVYASPALARGVLAIASGDGRVYGLDPDSGRELWRFELPPGNTAFAQSVAATDGERFYIGAWDNGLYALEALTGRQAWRQACCPTTFAYSPAIGSPCVADGCVYVAANGNRLFSFEAETGRLLWEVASKGDKYGHSGPVRVGDRVVVGCLGDSGEVRCVRADTGEELWVARTGSVIYDSSPAVWNGYLAIGSVDALLSVLRVGDGSVVDQRRLPPGHFLSTPAFHDGVVYAATFSNRAVALRLRV
ncbi:MAG: PQQ-binding-like beta-propeller repeat protein [Fimbriimonadales bacterium]|nr:PQQ-binding-like beta-propeller repeat protein [Fimbriimonadales bacterium]